MLTHRLGAHRRLASLRHVLRQNGRITTLRATDRVRDWRGCRRDCAAHAVPRMPDKDMGSDNEVSWFEGMIRLFPLLGSSLLILTLSSFVIFRFGPLAHPCPLYNTPPPSTHGQFSSSPPQWPAPRFTTQASSTLPSTPLYSSTSSTSSFPDKSLVCPPHRPSPTCLPPF